jgi:hypothetical protein
MGDTKGSAEAGAGAGADESIMSDAKKRRDAAAGALYFAFLASIASRPATACCFSVDGFVCLALVDSTCWR